MTDGMKADARGDTMRICRYWSADLQTALVGIVRGDDVLGVKLSDLDPSISYAELLALPGLSGFLGDQVRDGIVAETRQHGELDVRPAPHRSHFLAPVEHQEVWGTGETYERDASDAADASPFDRAYHADRPELFFKTTANRVIGPNGTIRVRSDGPLTFPESEFGVVISPVGEINGFTIANDVTAYGLCDENILYMPYVKTYDGACALGPYILLADSAPSWHTFDVELTISRQEEIAFEGGTTLARMVRPIENIIRHLFRDRSFPHGVVLMTGLGFDLPRGFTIRPGDETEIRITDIGVLRNEVL